MDRDVLDKSSFGDTMKVDIGERHVIIGKRVTIGAAINSIASIFAFLFPERAPAIVAAAVPLTFLVQVFIANRYGVTQQESL